MSLYLLKECPLSATQISSEIKSVQFTNKTLIIVKNTIDKLVNIVNNVSELTDKLCLEFSQDNDIQQLIADLICISETFSHLKDEKAFRAVIDENLKKLEQCRQHEEQQQLKKIYTEVNDDETEALKIQMKLRDKINKLRIGEN